MNFLCSRGVKETLEKMGVSLHKVGGHLVLRSVNNPELSVDIRATTDRSGEVTLDLD